MRRLKDGIPPLVYRILFLALQSTQNSRTGANCLWTLNSSFKSRLIHLISFKAQKNWLHFRFMPYIPELLPTKRTRTQIWSRTPSRTTLCTSFQSSCPCTPRRRRPRPRCHWPYLSSTCRSSLCYSRRVAATRLRKKPRYSLSSSGGNVNGDAKSCSAPHTAFWPSLSHMQTVDTLSHTRNAPPRAPSKPARQNAPSVVHAEGPANCPWSFHPRNLGQATRARSTENGRRYLPPVSLGRQENPVARLKLPVRYFDIRTYA